MVYLLKMVIFHGYVSHNQMVMFFSYLGPKFADYFHQTTWTLRRTKALRLAGAERPGLVDYEAGNTAGDGNHH